MAEICDINLNILRATHEDFIRVETFLDTNDIINSSYYQKNNIFISMIYTIRLSINAFLKNYRFIFNV